MLESYFNWAIRKKTENFTNAKTRGGKECKLVFLRPCSSTLKIEGGGGGGLSQCWTLPHTFDLRGQNVDNF